MFLQFHRTFVCFLLPLASALLFLGGSARAQDTVVTLNEIQYHPAGGKPEWVELHNQMSIRVDLSGWKLSGGIDFVFPDGFVIEPQAHVVVSGGGEPLEGALGPFTGRLSNGGDTIRLLGINGRQMDWCRYEDGGDWPKAADGSGATLSKRKPHLASMEAGSWDSSYRVGGTPMAPNFPMPDPRSAVLAAFSEVPAAGQGWVEIGHARQRDVSFDGLKVFWWEGLERREVLLSGKVKAGEVMVLEGGSFPGQLGDGTLLFLETDEGVIVDGVEVRGRGRQRQTAIPGAPWFVPEEASPGEKNSVIFPEGIVINEIMYHFPPNHENPHADPPVAWAENDEEWIELFNRSEDTVDLSGWRLDGGIGFDFPENTMMAPGTFLVVARDGEALRIKYPEISVLGDYSGGLGNDNDRILLKDGLGNVVDDVRYHDSGRWSKWADGGGSSLELISPDADNAVPESWAASDESAKSEWTKIRYQGRAVEPPGNRNPDRFHEFLLGLLDDAEVLVDDVSVTENPGIFQREVIQNGAFDETNVFDPTSVPKWRILGTHSGSVVEDPDDGKVLRLVATGRMEHSYNLASTTLANSRQIQDGNIYEISFRARWLRGTPMVNSRLYFNRLSRTSVLPVPDRLGSPGRANGRFVENVGPSVLSASHSPLVPEPADPVLITATVTDPDGVESVRVRFRKAGEPWEMVPMIHLGGGGFTATLPVRDRRTVVQWYLIAEDSTGAESLYPAGGKDSRALYRVGDLRVGEQDVSTVRLLMLPEEERAMTRPEHAVSNGRIGGTLIYNDTEVYYNVGIRLRSSPYGRPGNRAGFNVRFEKPQLFRGLHQTIALDRGVVMPNGNSDGHFFVGVGASTNELLVNQIAYGAGGLPSSHDDVVFVETPDSGDSSLAQLRMARFGRQYMKGLDEDGTLHKYELVYYPVRSVDGDPESFKDRYSMVIGVDIGDMGDDKEAYRHNFLVLNQQARDDFSGIVKVGRALSSPVGERAARADEVLNMDQWLRLFAFESLIGVADTFNMGLGHNLILHTPSDGGKVEVRQWDLDHAFYYSPGYSYLGGGNTNWARVLEDPAIRRRYIGHLQEIMTSSYNLDHLGPWIDHLDEVTRRDFGSRFRSYIDARRNSVRAQIRSAAGTADFSIRTGNGSGITVPTNLVMLEGVGSADMKSVQVVESGEVFPLEWTGLDTWRVRLPLQPGENQVRLQALDYRDRVIVFGGSDSIQVTVQNDAEPASADNLRITEIHYHPAGTEEGGNLEFVELTNLGQSSVELEGCRFSRGLEFVFDRSEIVAAGESVVVVGDQTAFAAAYGGGISVVGMWNASRLSNGGETIELLGATGEVVDVVEYDDRFPWPEESDGEGFSLVRRRGTEFTPGGAEFWRSSVVPGGSPGEREGVGYEEWRTENGRGEPEEDPDGNGLTELLEYALGYDLPDRPVVAISGNQGTPEVHMWERVEADDVEWVTEFSTDLVEWHQVEPEGDIVEERKGTNNGQGFRGTVWRLHSDDGMYLRRVVRFRDLE